MLKLKIYCINFLYKRYYMEKEDNIKKKIIFLRHGKTKNEHLIKDEFITIAKNIAKMIAKIITLEKLYENVYFVSSPLERCIDTASMVISEVNTLLKTNYKNNTDEKLKRWEKGKETREKSYERAINFRTELKKINSPLIIVISHSSMIPKLVYGSVINKYSNKEFKKECIKDKGKLVHGSFSIVKFDKQVKYNIDSNDIKN